MSPNWSSRASCKPTFIITCEHLSQELSLWVLFLLLLFLLLSCKFFFFMTLFTFYLVDVSRKFQTKKMRCFFSFACVDFRFVQVGVLFEIAPYSVSSVINYSNRWFIFNILQQVFNGCEFIQSKYGIMEERQKKIHKKVGLIFPCNLIYC